MRSELRSLDMVCLPMLDGLLYAPGACGAGGRIQAQTTQTASESGVGSGAVPSGDGRARTGRSAARNASARLPVFARSTRASWPPKLGDGAALYLFAATVLVS